MEEKSEAECTQKRKLEMPEKSSQYERRHDFDWLRVIVFGILIFYHTGLIFGYSLWMINNDESSLIIELGTEFFSQWRLPILFIISGLGVSFGLKRDLEKYFYWKDLSVY